MGGEGEEREREKERRRSIMKYSTRINVNEIVCLFGEIRTHFRELPSKHAQPNNRIGLREVVPPEQESITPMHFNPKAFLTALVDVNHMQ